MVVTLQQLVICGSSLRKPFRQRKASEKGENADYTRAILSSHASRMFNQSLWGYCTISCRAFLAAETLSPHWTVNLTKHSTLSYDSGYIWVFTYDMVSLKESDGELAPRKREREKRKKKKKKEHLIKILPATINNPFKIPSWERESVVRVENLWQNPQYQQQQHQRQQQQQY